MDLQHHLVAEVKNCPSCVTIISRRCVHSCTGSLWSSASAGRTEPWKLTVPDSCPRMESLLWVSTFTHAHTHIYHYISIKRSVSLTVSDLCCLSSTLCPMSPSTARSTPRRRQCSRIRTKPTSRFTLCPRASRTQRWRWGIHLLLWYHHRIKSVSFLNPCSLLSPEHLCRIWIWRVCQLSSAGDTLQPSSVPSQSATTRSPAAWRFWISPARSRTLWARWGKTWGPSTAPWRSSARPKTRRRLRWCFFIFYVMLWRRRAHHLIEFRHKDPVLADPGHKRGVDRLFLESVTII